MSRKTLASCTGFDWDEGNANKNLIAHQVHDGECEEVFFNAPLIVADDKIYSSREKRYYVLGRTDKNRFLFVAFTVRNNLIRVISARDMNKRETRKYYEKIKRDSKI
jgi:uncharacterized DUF497 family protein